MIILNQGIPPYKGKKVVYYETPYFKTKAFSKTPDMKMVNVFIKLLPSKKITPISSQDRIQYLKSIDIYKEIPSDFNVFLEEDIIA